MSKELVVYSTIVGDFFVNTPELGEAVGKARAKVGDDVWKKGFSADDPKGATAAAVAELKSAGIKPVRVEGTVNNVSYGENTDGSGNVYPKLKVDIQNNDRELLVSLDLKSDVAQRMIAKLDGVNSGDSVKISAWASPVEKGERTFINHAVSIKNQNGEEIKVNPAFSESVKSQTQALEANLKNVGVQDKSVINTARNTKRIEIHKAKLQDIEERFKK